MGDSPPGGSLKSLYPVGRATLEQHHDLLLRHARKFETGKMRDEAANARLVKLENEFDELGEKLGEVRDEMRDTRYEIQTARHQTEELSKQLASTTALVTQLNGKLTENAGKTELRKTLVNGLFAFLIAGVTAFGTWAAVSVKPAPDSPQLSSEQRRDMVRQENARRAVNGDQPVSAEFERSLPVK